MKAVIGIDLGTTNSVVSHLVDGRAVPIAIDGDAIVPSVVLYLDGRVIVGREAKNLELVYPDKVVRSAKRKIGSEHRYDVGGKHLAPEEVSAEVLRVLARGAEAAVGTSVREVVITVPAYFDDAQRKATLRAGELAGLDVQRLLNEPTAASLVYEQLVSAEHDEAGSELVLVYDLGGGTFDVSVLEVFEGVREVRATTGNSRLGGDDFDDKLLQHFLEVLKARHGVDPRDDARAMARLRRLAEDTKIRLSREASVTLHEEFLTTHDGQPIHLALEVTRVAFEAMIEPLLASTMEMAERAVREANIDASELRRILLVGGSTRIPMVRRLLRERFVTPHEERAPEIYDAIDPDLAVALGAAVQAGILVGAPVDKLLVDVSAHTLGMRVLSELDDDWSPPDTFAPIIPRNTVLPATRTEVFSSIVDQQSVLDVEVFQGERARASHNTLVGRFRTSLEPRPQGSPIHVTFAYDLDGIVEVTIAQPGVAPSKAVALTVSDKAREAAPASTSAIERKAGELAERLDPQAKAALMRLVDAYRAASGAARVSAEEALLDFFLDHGDD